MLLSYSRRSQVAGRAVRRSSSPVTRVPTLTDDELLDLLHRVATEVGRELLAADDWDLAGTEPGQHRSDLLADEVALRMLGEAPVGVLSEESGLHDAGRDLVVVVDPLDGSTNAARGIPWFATSLCAVDDEGPRVAVVRNQVSGVTFEAVRGTGARGDGEDLAPSGCGALSDAVVGLSGLADRWMGWKQYRALGAAALDLCLVASGVLDGYLDCSVDAHGPWDYMAAVLICSEAGAVVGDALGRDLVVLEHAGRRTPVAAATPELFDELMSARRS